VSLVISVSHEARITGVSHLHRAPFLFLSQLFQAFYYSNGKLTDALLNKRKSREQGATCAECLFRKVTQVGSSRERRGPEQ
jgi:hypothetical protein